MTVVQPRRLQKIGLGAKIVGHHRTLRFTQLRTCNNCIEFHVLGNRFAACHLQLVRSSCSPHIHTDRPKRQRVPSQVAASLQPMRAHPRPHPNHSGQTSGTGGMPSMPPSMSGWKLLSVGSLPRFEMSFLLKLRVRNDVCETKGRSRQLLAIACLFLDGAS